MMILAVGMTAVLCINVWISRRLIRVNASSKGVSFRGFISLDDELLLGVPVEPRLDWNWIGQYRQTAVPLRPVFLES